HLKLHPARRPQPPHVLAHQVLACRQRRASPVHGDAFLEVQVDWMVPAATAIDVGPVLDLARFRDQQRGAVGIEGVRVLAVDFYGPGKAGSDFGAIGRALAGAGIARGDVARTPELDHPGAYRIDDRDLLRQRGWHQALVEASRLVHVARHVDAVDRSDDAELQQRPDRWIFVG